VLRSSQNSLLRVALPTFVLGSLVIAAVGLFLWSIDREQNRVRSEHQAVAQATAAQLKQTLEGTIGGLRGLRGLHDANAKVTPRQFGIVSQAVLDQHELQGTQWVMYVRPETRQKYSEAHKLEIQVATANGRVRAPRAPVWGPVTLVAPLEAHRRSLGIDHLSIPERRPALLRSRDLGRAQVSAPNQLSAAGKPLGLQVFLPVYAPGAPTRTVLQRRTAMRGWVGGVYELKGLGRVAFSGLEAGSKIEVSTGDQTLMKRGEVADSGQERRLTFAGQTWRLRASSNAVFSWMTPLLILVAGLAVTLLVALVMLQSRRRERSMVNLLDERKERAVVEAALSETEEQNRSIVNSAPDGILTTDVEGQLESMNPAAEAMFQCSANDALGGSISMLFALPENLRSDPGGVVGLLRRSASSGRDADLVGIRGEQRFPIEARVSTLRATGGFTVAARDVTEQRLAEAEERALRKVATAVASGEEPEVLFNLVAKEAGQLYEAFGAYVVRCHDSGAQMLGRWGAFDDSEIRDIEPRSQDTCTRAVKSGEPAITRDFEQVEDSSMGKYGVRSAIAAPVKVNGRPWGAVGVASGSPGAFSPGSEQHLLRFAEFVSMAIANADARARLVAWAATDELTGLPNQRTFHERLATEVERAQRHGHRLSLALFDVDRFKAVNDTHGHQTGDQVLIEIGERLRGIMRTSDVIARVGGEEFGWIMVDTDGLGAWRAADRARDVIEATPFPQVGPVTVSGGICQLAPTGSAGEIFRLADIALYWAKAHGRNVCFRYSPDVIEVLSAEERSEQMERIQRVGTIMGLARAVDAKDASTQRHSERVASLAARLARQLGWSEQRAALLHEAALVHDVGKIALPDALLIKAGPLTDAEYEQVKMHAELGGRIVEGCLSSEQVAWVRGHHERFDGKGYPDRLGDVDIPEGARILALADAWDAMTEVRLYRQARGQEDALRECLRNSGTQFWPEAVEALQEIAQSGRLIALSDMEPGAVPELGAPDQIEAIGTHGGEMSRLRADVSDPAHEFGQDVADFG